MTTDHMNNLRRLVSEYAAALIVDDESTTSARIIDPSTDDLLGKIDIQPASVRNITFHHFERNFHTSSIDYMLPDVSNLHELENNSTGKALRQNFLYEIAARQFSIAPSRET